MFYWFFHKIYFPKFGQFSRNSAEVRVSFFEVRSVFLNFRDFVQLSQNLGSIVSHLHAKVKRGMIRQSEENVLRFPSLSWTAALKPTCLQNTLRKCEGNREGNRLSLKHVDGLSLVFLTWLAVGVILMSLLTVLTYSTRSLVPIYKKVCLV